MNARGFEVRGWHVLAAMLAFFGFVIAVNVAFTIAAVRSFPGEDVRRSYLQGLHYNRTLAERRAQAALAWSATAHLVARDEGPALEVFLADRRGQPIDTASLTGELQWPTDARFDRAVTFNPAGEGRYFARLGELPAGRWRLRARAHRGRAAFDFESELTWRASR
jgi:nitrogen fixation protein FixH